jgi:hypothetical protein
MSSRHVTIHGAAGLYSSHPCITALRSGDWLVVFSQSVERKPFLHPPADPLFMNLICRSGDQGATWGDAYVVPDYHWSGVENPGIAQLSNADLLLNQWRFVWHPVHTARKLWSQGEGTFFVCDDPGDDRHRWRPAATAADWDSHPYPWARSDDGAYVHISTDEGRTWGQTVAIDIAPYRGAFSPKGAIQLPDGDVLLALGSHDYDPLAATFVVRSHDLGRSWRRPVEAARADGLVFSEPSIARTQSGKLLVMSREEATGHIFQSESLDDGHTWSPPRKLDFWGYPTHCIPTSDGRVLIVYGRRRPPYGIRAAVSDDEAVSWGPEIVLRDDLPNDNLGYPSVIEYAPGRFFTAYYGEDDAGLTCIQGTYFAA